MVAVRRVSAPYAARMKGRTLKTNPNMPLGLIRRSVPGIPQPDTQVLGRWPNKMHFITAPT